MLDSTCPGGIDPDHECLCCAKGYNRATGAEQRERRRILLIAKYLDDMGHLNPRSLEAAACGSIEYGPMSVEQEDDHLHVTQAVRFVPSQVDMAHVKIDAPPLVDEPCPGCGNTDPRCYQPECVLCGDVIGMRDPRRGC